MQLQPHAHACSTKVWGFADNKQIYSNVPAILELKAGPRVLPAMRLTFLYLRKYHLDFSPFHSYSVLQDIMDVIRAYLADPVPITLGVLPKVPLATQTVLQYALGISETSKQWSIRLEVTAKMMRAFIQSNPPPSISTQQKFSLTGFPITKKQWISDITFQPPKEDDIRQALFAAIEGLANHDGRFIEPEIAPVTGEWTGYCVSGCSKNGMTERQKYQGMMSEAMSRITVLYFHGGAYYLMDPATHRPTVAKIAKYTKGRVLSIRYRLAPKYPFPSALLDALLAYLTLLYPPPGSFHEPIPADQIVFAGDSSGGNL